MKFMTKGAIYGYKDMGRKFLVLSEPFRTRPHANPLSIIMWMDTRLIESTPSDLVEDEEEKFT